MAWRLATWPTRRSPLSVNATIEGVVRPPSLLEMIWTVPLSRTDTQQFVVPRSIPITLLIKRFLEVKSVAEEGVLAGRSFD